MRKITQGILGIYPPKIDTLGSSPVRRDAGSIAIKVASHDGPAPIYVYDEDIRNQEISEGSLAVHLIDGPVYYDCCYWGFSTKRFTDNIRAAEADGRIAAHLLLCDSPGGEVFGVHEAHQAVRECAKPVVAVCVSMMASAAYWICSAAHRVYAISDFSEVGSIGVMARLLDNSCWLEMNGLKEITLYADGSDLKNKDIKDALSGKGEHYINKFLNPILTCMQNDITGSRKNISGDSDALRGEIYYATEGMEIGLIDGVKSVDECIGEAFRMGEERDNINQLISAI